MSRDGYDGISPGFGKTLGRGLTRRCARCGSGTLFRYWLIMTKSCPRCGLHFELPHGYWLGAVALNLVLTEGLFVFVLVAMIAATWPDVPWTLVLVVLVTMNVTVPLVAHPFTKTVWIAVERHFSGTWAAGPTD